MPIVIEMYRIRRFDIVNSLPLEVHECKQLKNILFAERHQFSDEYSQNGPANELSQNEIYQIGSE